MVASKVKKMQLLGLYPIGNVPLTHGAFRVKLENGTYSNTLQVKQADGTYRRFVVKRT